MSQRFTPKTSSNSENVQSTLDEAPINIFKLMANSPAAFEGYLGMKEALSGEFSALEAKERELIALCVAGYNECDYCASAHTKIGIDKAKLTKGEATAALAGESNDKKTQAMFTFVRALLGSRGGVTETEFQAVKDAGWSEEEIIEMIAHVSFNIFTNYFNRAAKTENDFPAVSAHDWIEAA